MTPENEYEVLQLMMGDLREMLQVGAGPDGCNRRVVRTAEVTHGNCLLVPTPPGQGTAGSGVAGLPR